MQLPSFAAAFARTIVRHPSVRAAAYRFALRAHEIVPFGHALTFDPYSWVTVS
jgi:hypothetical protein